MKTSTPELRALLHGSREASFANLITLTTKAGTTVRWAAGGMDVVYSGNTYTGSGTGTAPLVQPMRIREAVGLEVSTLDLNMDCGSTAQIGGVALQLAALNGVLDDARVTVHRAYMATPGGAVVGVIHRFAGLVSDCEVDSYAVRLRVQSDLYKLEEQLPRHLIRERCSWALGDAGCGVNLASFTTVEAVADTSSSDAIKMGDATVAESPIVVGGTATFTSGVLNGQRRNIASTFVYPPVKFGFRVVPPFSAAPAIGDTVSIVFGCDKTIATCRDVFSNLNRRRGFDFVPSPEQVTR